VQRFERIIGILLFLRAGGRLTAGELASRFDVSAQNGTRSTQSGVYFGRFFCMNGACPARTRITDSGRLRRCVTIRSAICST